MPRHPEVLQGEQTRAAIVQALRANPGASVRELARAVGQPNSYASIAAHIRRLIAEGRLIEVRPTGTRRWQVAGLHPVIQAAQDWRRAIADRNGVHVAEQALLTALSDYDAEEGLCRPSS